MLDIMKEFERTKSELIASLESVANSSKLIQQKRQTRQPHLRDLDKAIAHLQKTIGGGK